MLTFLNSAILIGLTAIAIPILIHLFTRKKTKIVDFSSLRFLKELQKRKIRRLKIRQILLLILRTLLVLFLVLSFARPALRQIRGASLKGGAQLTAVLILDNTLSMGYQVQGTSLLEQAKEKALEITSLLRPGDEIYLIYPQDPPLLAHEGPKYSPESFRELIQNTALSYSRTDYLHALSLAHDLVSNSANINKEVYLIGDLQENGLPTLNNGNGTLLLGKDVHFFVLPTTATETTNLSISELRLGNQILEKGKVVELNAVIQNSGQKAVKNKLVHLFLNGKRVGQDAVDLEPSAANTVIFRMVPERAGLQSGYVLLEDDDLLEDNRRYFSLHIPEEIPVLVIGSNEDTYFLNMALTPDRNQSTYFKLKNIARGELSKQDLGQFRCVIMSNIAMLEPAEAQQIQDFVSAGGGLVVFLGADVNLRNYNETLHKKLNLPLLTESITSTQNDQFLSLGKFDFSHPIFRDVFEGEKNVLSPHFRFAINLKADRPIDKIIEFSNGAPFLFEAQYLNGRILYLTSGVSSNWSDLAVRGIFVLLLNRSVVYLAGETAEEKGEHYVQSEITYNPSNLAYPDLTIEDPSGDEVKIKPDVSQGKYSIRFSATGRPGVYKLLNKREQVTQWAVNYDPAETANASLAPEELKNVLETEQVFVIRDTDQIAEKLTESRFGMELWKYFAAAALILLLVEMIIFRENSTAAQTT